MCQSMRIQRDLVSAGLIVNESKFQWIPTKCIVWLGFELDLNQAQPVYNLGDQVASIT